MLLLLLILQPSDVQLYALRLGMGMLFLFLAGATYIVLLCSVVCHAGSEICICSALASNASNVLKCLLPLLLILQPSDVQIYALRLGMGMLGLPLWIRGLHQLPAVVFLIC